MTKTLRYEAHPAAQASALLQSKAERLHDEEVIRQFDLEKLEALAILGDLIHRFGASRVASWLLFKAKEMNSDIESL